MLKMNLQIFAHKKVLVLQRTAEILSLRDLVLKSRRSVCKKLVTSFTDSVVQRSIQVLM